MATYLYRVGKWAYVNRLKAIGAWFLILIGMGVAASALAGPTSESFSIPGIPSERAQNLMVDRFPDKKPFTEDVSVSYVVKAPDGQKLTEQRYQDAINSLADNLKKVDGVEKPETIANPFTAFGTPERPGPAQQMAAEYQEKTFGKTPEQAKQVVAAAAPISADQNVATMSVKFTTTQAADVSTTAHDQLDAAAQTARDAGLTVEMSGTGLPQPALGMTSEAIGIAVAAIILMITFASMVAWGMPIITAIIGVAIGMMGVTVASGFFDLSSETPVLATMIGLAVGIDYALFIVSRYRHELRRNATRAEAAGMAVGTAGSAVVFAGLTVIIALAALTVVGIPFLSAMGIAAAGTVLVAVLVALTLVPAVLGLLGGKAFAARIPGLNAPDSDPTTPVTENEEAEANSNGRRWVSAVVKRPMAALAFAIVVLGVVAIPMVGLKLALPNNASEDPSTTQRKAYDITSQAFGEGNNSPLVVVADGTKVDPQQRMSEYSALADDIAGNPDVKVAAIGGDGVSKNSDTAIISVIPKSGPSDEATTQLVTDLRNGESAFSEKSGLTYGVTGQTAIENDVSQRLSDALLPYLFIVVGLAFILLVLVFRSILVPLTAALGFLLSVAATFGATVAIFSDGALGIISNTQPIVSFLPIFLIGVVFGLAMDYQVFLVTRMREEYVHGRSAKQAIIEGFSHSGRVVAAAATVMISVFVAFMLQDMAFIKEMGFALAIAVFFDAFIVRMIAIPAVLSLLGDRAWWIPRWLDKIIPNVDVEGEKLTREHKTVPDADDDKVSVGV